MHNNRAWWIIGNFREKYHSYFKSQFFWIDNGTVSDNALELQVQQMAHGAILEMKSPLSCSMHHLEPIKIEWNLQKHTEYKHPTWELPSLLYEVNGTKNHFAKVWLDYIMFAALVKYILKCLQIMWISCTILHIPKCSGVVPKVGPSSVSFVCSYG